MEPQEFRAELESDQRGVARIRLPFDPSIMWGTQRRHYVRGKIEGAEFLGSLGARGGQWFFPVNKALQNRIGVAPGDSVHVRIEPAEPPQATVPADLAKAMAAAAGTPEFFDQLSGFYQRQYVEWVEGAKSSDTRTSRIDTVVDLLRQGRKQR